MSLFGTNKCELCGRASEDLTTFVTAQHQGGTVHVCKDKSTCLPWNPAAGPNESKLVALDPNEQAPAHTSSRPAYVKPKRSKAAEVDEQDRLVELAKELHAKKARKAELEAELKDTNKAIDKLDEELGELMETRKVDLFRVAGYGTFYTQVKNYPSIVDPEEFINWLDAQGEGAMAKRTVHPSTLQAWVKERLENNLGLPKAKSSLGQEYDLINNFQKVRVGTRKA